MVVENDPDRGRTTIILYPLEKERLPKTLKVSLREIGIIYLRQLTHLSPKQLFNRLPALSAKEFAAIERILKERSFSLRKRDSFLSARNPQVMHVTLLAAFWERGIRTYTQLARLSLREIVEVIARNSGPNPVTITKRISAVLIQLKKRNVSPRWDRCSLEGMRNNIGIWRVIEFYLRGLRTFDDLAKDRDRWMCYAARPSERRGTWQVLRYMLHMRAQEKSSRRNR